MCTQKSAGRKLGPFIVEDPVSLCLVHKDAGIILDRLRSDPILASDIHFRGSLGILTYLSASNILAWARRTWWFFASELWTSSRTASIIFWRAALILTFWDGHHMALLMLQGWRRDWTHYFSISYNFSILTLEIWHASDIGRDHHTIVMIRRMGLIICSEEVIIHGRVPKIIVLDILVVLHFVFLSYKGLCFAFIILQVVVTNTLFVINILVQSLQFLLIHFFSLVDSSRVDFDGFCKICMPFGFFISTPLLLRVLNHA